MQRESHSQRDKAGKEDICISMSRGRQKRVQRQSALASARTDCREACKDRVDRKTTSKCTETSKHRMQRESQSQRYKTDLE